MFVTAVQYNWRSSRLICLAPSPNSLNFLSETINHCL